MRNVVALVVLGALGVVGASSLSPENGSLTAHGEVVSEALAANSFFALQSAVKEGGGASPARAVELRAGESTSFGELSLTISSLSEASACVTTSCLEADIHVALGNGETHRGTYAEGETLSLAGYTVKVSQIAPNVLTGSAARRAVLIFSRD